MTKKEIFHIVIIKYVKIQYPWSIFSWLNFSGRCIRRREAPSNSNDDEDIEIVEVNDNKTVIINAITECHQNDTLIINESTQLQNSPA